MDRLNFLLVTLAERLFRPAHNVRLQILEAQIRFLRSRIEASRIVPSPEEKHELLSKPESTGHGEIFSSCRKTFLCRNVPRTCRQTSLRHGLTTLQGHGSERLWPSPEKRSFDDTSHDQLSF